ncbi:MAG: RNA-binding protein [bacterium]|nr:RNA-binding protein [bacterium]
MGKKLFVGNLPFRVTSEQLGDLFAKVGTIQSAAVIMDRATGQSRGFGFVEMSSEDEARRAVEELNGQDFDGRKLNVSEAHDRGGGGGGARPRY